MPQKEKKRRFKRLKAHYLLKYKANKETPKLCFVRNISGGGVFFHTKEKIPLGSETELIINFPPYPDFIKTVVKVVRVVALEKTGGFDIAGEFIELNDKDRDFINKRILSIYKIDKPQEIY